MKTENLGVVISMKNETGNPFPKNYFVGVAGTNCNSGEEDNDAVGVCLADTEADGQMPVAVTGVVLALTGGAINATKSVKCDGKIYQLDFTDPPTADELRSVVGKALDSASGADELIRILLK